MFIRCCVLSVALVACGDKKSEQPAQGSAVVAKKLDVAALLAGTKGPTLIGPYAKARFGMTQDELFAAVPDAVDFHDRKAKHRDPDGAYYVWFDQTEAKRGFEILTVYLPADQIGEVEKAWGKPTHFEGVYGGRYDVWLDRDARIRAHLGRSAADEPTLELMPYQPLQETLGAAGLRFSTETKRPFVGSTGEELMADYPTQARLATGQVSIMFPIDEYHPSNIFDVLLLAPDGKTTGFVYSVAHGGNPQVKQERLDMLVAKYGAASGIGPFVLGKHTPEVVVIDKDGTWTVESPRRQ